MAAGSAEAVEAAITVLRAGGSAVDAALAAAMAAAVSEPVLTSLGGGGFLLHAVPGQQPEVLDFFVAVPGLAGGVSAPHVETVVIDFASAGPAARSSEQVFHGGWGTVGVPGCFAGYGEAHRRWGRLPLADIVGPAIELARRGVRLGSVQLAFLTLVEQLLLLTPGGRSLFAGVRARGDFANPDYARLLDDWAKGAITGPDDPAYVGPLLAASQQNGGLLDAVDLAAYAPELHPARVGEYGGVRLATNPLPSMGGSIVVDALGRLPATGPVPWAELVAAQSAAREAHRRPGQTSTGTTHISVLDRDGTVAALTTSDGSGSGAVVPGWGVTLNNMLGEEDLHTGEPLRPGERMGSMMAPSLLTWPDGGLVVLGTGGSERIRSALICTIARLVLEDGDLADAIEAPRAHVDGNGQVHLEPGFLPPDVAAIDRLAAERGWPDVSHWPSPTVFFGGVHAVRRLASGEVEAIGDARRGGVAAVLGPDGSVRQSAS